VHGKSHDSMGYYLTPYNGVVHGYKIVNGYFTSKIKPTVRENRTLKPTKKDLFLNKWKNYDFFSI
jgi:hypothetical protein